MLTEKEKRQILNHVLETVEGVSNKDYQKRVWIRGEGPEFDDFDETCCNFFDDGDPLLESYQDFGMTDSQHQILKKFRDEFDLFIDKPESYWPPDFIDTPDWEHIMKLANEVLKAFDYKKTL